MEPSLLSQSSPESHDISSTSTDNAQSLHTPQHESDTWTPPEWAKGLDVPPEILRAPMFSSIKNMNDIVKGYHSAQKMVGADKIIVPTKNSTPEEWKNFYVKAGHPESLENYKVELPKSFDDQAFNSELMKQAYENNISPDQLKRISDLVDTQNEKIIADYEASVQQEVATATEDLKKEWGQGFDKQITRANRVIKHFGGEEMHGAVSNSELANNPQFIRLMAKIGEKMTGEDTFKYETTSSFGMTKEETKSKINALMGDMSGPYHNENHAQHREYVDKMLHYQELLSSN